MNTTLAIQFIDQLPPAFRTALFGNVGTVISFRTGAEDAAYLSREFYPVFAETDFVNLPKYNMYLKLLIDGIPSQGFSAQTLPFIAPPTGNRERVIEHSRVTYGCSPLAEQSRPATTISLLARRRRLAGL